MPTKLKLGPTDHGRELTWEEYYTSDYQEGYKYELIDGRLYVSPLPNLAHDCLEHWLYRLFLRYVDTHSDVANHARNKARVFVPGRDAITAPEPDIAVYRGFPLHLPIGEVNWQDVSPILVIEILLDSDPPKDLVRNRDLYFQVPSIREYWVLDGRTSPAQPSLLVHRRHGRQWRIREFAAGEIYTTRLLPDFELRLTPQR